MKYTYKLLKKCITLALITMMALLAFAIPATPVYAAGTITNADDASVTYASFAEAIDSIPAGYTLNLNVTGEFTEDIVIDKAVTVTITGEGIDNTNINGTILASNGATLSLVDLEIINKVTYTGQETSGSIQSCRIHVFNANVEDDSAVEVLDGASLTTISDSILIGETYNMIIGQGSKVSSLINVSFDGVPRAWSDTHGYIGIKNEGTIDLIKESSFTTVNDAIFNHDGGHIGEIDQCLFDVYYYYHGGCYGIQNYPNSSIDTIKNCTFKCGAVNNSGDIQTITKCEVDATNSDGTDAHGLDYGEELGIVSEGFIDEISECNIKSQDTCIVVTNTYDYSNPVPGVVNRIINVNLESGGNLFREGALSVVGGEVGIVSGGCYNGLSSILVGCRSFGQTDVFDLPGKIGTVENITGTAGHAYHTDVGGIVVQTGEIGSIKNARLLTPDNFDEGLVIGVDGSVGSVEDSFFYDAEILGKLKIIKNTTITRDLYIGANAGTEKIIGGTYGVLDIEFDDVVISDGPVLCSNSLVQYHIDDGRAIENKGQNIVLEPDLAAESPLQGYGRYYSIALGGDGLIRNDDDNHRILPKFREGTPDEQTYHMSKRGELLADIEEIFATDPYYNSEAIEGIKNAKFRYLTVDVEVKFLKNDSAATGVTDTYADEWRPDLPAPECGYRNGIKIFDGWNTKADGSGTMYQVGDFIDIPDTKLSLYAQWADPTHTVSFDSDGGTKVDSQTVDHKAKANKPEDPTRENYTFVAWLLNGNRYNFDAPVTKDITLKAQWERIPTAPVTTMHTITYDLNGGTLYGETGIIEVQYDEGTTIQLPKPEKEGCTFDYWEGSRYEAGDDYTIMGDHTFTAHWIKEETRFEEETEFQDEDENCEEEDEDNPEGTPVGSTPNNTPNTTPKDGDGSSTAEKINKKSPKTADDSDIFLWIAMMCGASLATAGSLKYRKRRR